jgi:tRNA (guanine10-N2)-dimethyltransferase
LARLFFLFSGEHEELPLSELKAILEAEGYAYRVLERFDQVAVVETDKACVKAVTQRAALTRVCGLELFHCKAKPSVMAEKTRSNMGNVLADGETFVVRIKHVKDYSSKIDGMALESKLGALILRNNTTTRVSLRNADKTFLGILTSNMLIFGQKIAEVRPKPFVERRPRKKPFFHPSAMQAKLARCMTNLAQSKAGELVLDPFCGTGSMLIEAGLIGCRVVGLDVQRRMVRGTLRNLHHFGLKPEGIILADIRFLPMAKVDRVVTDPPYGISSTTLKRTTKQLVEECLSATHKLLNKGQRICIAAPKTLGVRRIGESLGYKHLESHFVYVHRSLTREIAVFEKV